MLYEHIAAQLKNPLPGHTAQFRMSAMKRIKALGLPQTPPPDAKVACVMNLLHVDESGTWRTVLIRRTANPHDRHSGQISFPGGRWEESDGVLEAVALRETTEEIGVPADQIQVLGQLTELYIPISNFLVYPFVGLLQGKSDFVPQPGEVAAILTPALDALLDPANLKTMDMRVADSVTLTDVPYFDIDGHAVWGATAMILSEFLTILEGALTS
jgi:8-oxo-dGTP pyrophosphatase MutT (NUDIX family)